MKFSTIGIFAHANAGKTTVTENLLFEAGLIESCGRVDNGNTITDTLQTEKERGITIKSSYITIDLGNQIVQLIDTPGHIDFSAEVIRAISVLDVAILVISGAEGIESQTINIWKMLNIYNIPIIFYINKLDRIGASYLNVIESIKNTFSNKIVNYQEIFISKSDIIIKQMPGNLLLEQLSEFDDQALEIYFANIEEKDKYEWMQRRFAELFRNNKMNFVLGGAALSGTGIKELFLFLKEYLPIYNNISDDFYGQVYTIKTIGQLKEIYIKILGGYLENRMEINTISGKQKIKTLKIIELNNKIDCGCGVAGQIVIVTGLDCSIGEYIGNYENQSEITDINLINPMFTAVLSVDDEDKKNELWNVIKSMNEEDPFLNCRYEKNTNSVRIDLMGKLQGETIVQMIEEKYSLKVSISEPSIVYKETIINESNAKAGYTKTSNVALKLIPGERNSGIKYTSLLGTDYLFEKYQKQVERLVKRYLKSGLLGWEVTDLEVCLIGGKCDNVGSESKDYNIAVPIALKRALKKSKTKLLEPIVSYSVKCPTENYKDVVSKLLSTKKGYKSINSIDENNYLIEGDAYLSEIIQFIGLIQEITSGKGSVEYINNGYDDAITPEMVYGNLNEVDPTNETNFIIYMNGNLQNLDLGLETKRGKPEKIKRNKHLWK